MRTITQVLDHAKKAQKVRSDYKLALCIGIGESSLSDYRKGRGLPDEINCIKLANAIGEDPALLTVEMQAQRAKTDEARDIWLGIAKRLQMGVSSVLFSCVLAIVAIAVNALPAWASADSVESTNGPTVYYVKQVKQALRLFSRQFVIFCEYVSLFCQWGNFRPA